MFQGEYQAITKAGITLKKPGISVFDKNFNRFDLDEYTIDSSFCYRPMPSDGDITKVGRVHIDRENKTFRDWFCCGNWLQRRRTIGPLENNWHVLIGLRGTQDYFVYIDNKGGAHSYVLGPGNW